MNINDFIQKSIVKKFSTRAKGYDPHEVDSFFDGLILKIKELGNKNELLEQQIDELNNAVTDLKKEKENLLSIIAGKEQQIEELNKSGFHNEAMARRIADLEKKVDKENK